MKKTKTQKGITLIVLIVTIVVLLILASVAISNITNNGIVDKAQETVNKYELAQEKEKLQIEVLEWELINSNGIPTLQAHLAEIYGEENVQLNVDRSITVTVASGNKYIVTTDGVVTLLDGTVEEPEEIIISVSLDKTEITKEITRGESVTESITATLNNGAGILNWTSSNTGVAEVIGNGNTATVTLKAEGTATITVSCGELSATCTVNVTEKKALISFTVDGTTYYAEEGMTWQDWIGSAYDTSNGLFSKYTLPSGTVQVLYRDSGIYYDYEIRQTVGIKIKDGGNYSGDYVVPPPFV